MMKDRYRNKADGRYIQGKKDKQKRREVVQKFEDERVYVKDYDFQRKSHQMLNNFIKQSHPIKSGKGKQKVVKDMMKNAHEDQGVGFLESRSFSTRKPIQLRNSISDLELDQDLEITRIGTQKVERPKKKPLPKQEKVTQAPVVVPKPEQENKQLKAQTFEKLPMVHHPHTCYRMPYYPAHYHHHHHPPPMVLYNVPERQLFIPNRQVCNPRCPNQCKEWSPMGILFLVLASVFLAFMCIKFIDPCSPTFQRIYMFLFGCPVQRDCLLSKKPIRFSELCNKL